MPRSLLLLVVVGLSVIACRSASDDVPASSQSGDAAAPSDAASAADRSPPIDARAFMAVQGIPTPQPGKPTPYFLVQCPGADGLVSVHVVSLDHLGVRSLRGVFAATYTKDGITDHVVVPDTPTSPSIEITVREEDSVLVHPFGYRATVTSDPALVDSSGHSFIARMYNPESPSMTDVGYAFSEYHLSDCR